MSFICRILIMFAFCGYMLQQQCLKGQKRNLSARNTLVQPLALYTDPESHNAERYRQTDRQTDGRTDRRRNDANDMMMLIVDNTVYQYDRLKINAV